MTGTTHVGVSPNGDKPLITGRRPSIEPLVGLQPVSLKRCGLEIRLIVPNHTPVPANPTSAQAIQRALGQGLRLSSGLEGVAEELRIQRIVPRKGASIFPIRETRVIGGSIRRIRSPFRALKVKVLRRIVLNFWAIPISRDCVRTETRPSGGASSLLQTSLHPNPC